MIRFSRRPTGSRVHGVTSLAPAPTSVLTTTVSWPLWSIAAEGSDHGSIIDRALRAIDVGEHELAAIVPGLVAVFSTHTPTVLAPYPGFDDALAAVRAIVPVACVTDGNPRIQRAKLRSLGLADAFDVVIFSDELGREFRKPHVAPFERALRELGVPAARAVHIGDRPGKDVVGAVKAGMRAVRVHTGEYATLADLVDAMPWRSFADVTSALAIDRGRARQVQPTDDATLVNSASRKTQ